MNAVVSAAINFLIIAVVVYFVIVVPYKKLKELDTKVEEEETELTLLTEIRDILAENGSSPGQAWLCSCPRRRRGEEVRHVVAPHIQTAPGFSAGG